MAREALTEIDVQNLIRTADSEYRKELNKKGPGVFVSTHEIRGAVDEEIDEMHDAVQDNDHVKLRSELVDIMVAAMHGIASIDKGKMDW